MPCAPSTTSGGDFNDSSARSLRPQQGTVAHRRRANPHPIGRITGWASGVARRKPGAKVVPLRLDENWTLDCDVIGGDLVWNWKHRKKAT